MINKKYFAVFLLLSIITLPAYSQFTTSREAGVIAEKWIQIITEEKAPWAETVNVIVGPIEEFKHEGKLIGYFCNLQPSGFIVFSLRRELAPVKAWSENGVFDPEDENGIEEVIKICMLRILDTIQSRYGSIADVATSDLISMTEIDYRQSWFSIENYIPGTFEKIQGPGDNYLPGDALLATNWDQFPPYNNNCPPKNCSNTSNGRAVVGCVATAAAQIMKYWSWPPGNYDWINMDFDVTTASPPAQQAAVAKLCADIGQAVEMVYGCDASSAYHTDMAEVYTDNFSYSSSVTVKYRSDYSAADWFNLIKFNLDRNRPMQYGIPGHSIVCDGYWETSNPVTKTYHMNYGWSGTSEDTWYTLDALAGGNPEDEDVIHRTYPSSALGYSLSGIYYPIPVYRYFDMDAAGSNATFMSGHKLQTLPWIKILGVGTASYVKFYGSTGHAQSFIPAAISQKGL